MEWLAERLIEPEFLDSLPPDDPRALEARRDLKWVNRLMFEAPIMRALMLRSVDNPPRRMLEIGCGDGNFMLTVARRLAPQWPGVEITLLDRAGIVTEERVAEFAWLGWQAKPVHADVFEWLGKGGHKFDLISANLILHHFTNERLGELFGLIAAAAPVFVAAEPHRNLAAVSAVQGLRLFGVNKVTLHDAAASVRSGFRGREMAALWRKGEGMEERGIGPFTQVFAARSPKKSSK